MRSRRVMARPAFVRGAKVPLHLESRFTFRATIAESADDSGMCSIIAGANIRSPCNLMIGRSQSPHSSVMIVAIRSHHRSVQVLRYGPVLLMFESLLARDECYHAAFGMNVFTVALEAAIRAVRIDRPCIVSLYR